MNDRQGNGKINPPSVSASVQNKASDLAKSNKSEADGSENLLDGDAAERPVNAAHRLAELRHDKDAIRRMFETGEYPYKKKLTRARYEKHKAELQTELLKVQDWVRATNQKIVLIFEGRDAAGKGGTIKRFTEHLNPRGARVVALDKPTQKERSHGFFNVTSSSSRQAERSFCTTGLGTIEPAWNALWASVLRTSIWSSCAKHLR